MLADRDHWPSSVPNGVISAIVVVLEGRWKAQQGLTIDERNGTSTCKDEWFRA